MEGFGVLLEGMKVNNTENFERKLATLDQPFYTEGMSEYEIVIRQKIESFKVEHEIESLDDTVEKGNYGELVTDLDMMSKGYERISTDAVIDVDQPGHQGIDGVYYKNDGKPEYVIVESKFGTGQLSDTMDGKQMSEAWIEKRLDDAVGKETADEIRRNKASSPDSVKSVLAHVDEAGKIAYDEIDKQGNVKKEQYEYVII